MSTREKIIHALYLISVIAIIVGILIALNIIPWTRFAGILMSIIGVIVIIAIAATTNINQSPSFGQPYKYTPTNA